MPILFTSNNETGHTKWDQGAVSFIYSLGTSPCPYSPYISVFQQYTTISYLSVQQSKLSPQGDVDDPMALLHEAEGRG